MLYFIDLGDKSYSAEYEDLEFDIWYHTDQYHCDVNVSFGEYLISSGTLVECIEACKNVLILILHLRKSK